MTKEVNLHGLKMVGLKKAAQATKYLKGFYDASYVQLGYDKSTGEILTNDHCSLGHNSWTEYNDSNCIRICNLTEPTTMQQIADKINDKLNELMALGY